MEQIFQLEEDNEEDDEERPTAAEGTSQTGILPRPPSRSGVECVQAAWTDFLEFHADDAILQLSAIDWDQASLQRLVDLVRLVPERERPKDLVWDLCTFHQNEQVAVEEGREEGWPGAGLDDVNGTHENRDELPVLVCEFFHLLRRRLIMLEVENRLLDRPWTPMIVSQFLQRGVGQLECLERLTLLGVDMRGQGPSLKRILISEEYRISWWNLSYCQWDRLAFLEFCEGLRMGPRVAQHLQILYLFDGGINDEMFRGLVDNLSASLDEQAANQYNRKNTHNTHGTLTGDKWQKWPYKDAMPLQQGRCQLQQLHLARNHLTFSSLKPLAKLLQQQPQLQVLSVSHNRDLFRCPNSASTRAPTLMPVSLELPLQNQQSHEGARAESTIGTTGSTTDDPPLYKLYRYGSSKLSWLPPRKYPELEQFLYGAFRHTSLLHLYTTTGGFSTSEPMAAAIEELVRPIGQRNQRLSCAWKTGPRQQPASPTGIGNGPLGTSTRFISSEHVDRPPSYRSSDDGGLPHFSVWPRALQRLGASTVPGGGMAESEFVAGEDGDERTVSIGGAQPTPVYAFLRCRLDELLLIMMGPRDSMKSEPRPALGKLKYE